MMSPPANEGRLAPCRRREANLSATLAARPAVLAPGRLGESFQVVVDAGWGHLREVVGLDGDRRLLVRTFGVVCRRCVTWVILILLVLVLTAVVLL